MTIHELREWLKLFDPKAFWEVHKEGGRERLYVKCPRKKMYGDVLLKGKHDDMTDEEEDAAEAAAIQSIRDLVDAVPI